MIKKLFSFLKKPRLPKKAQAFIPLALFVVLLLSVGIFALTQEAGDSEFQDREGVATDVLDPDDIAFLNGEWDILPEWTPPGPPRWFRSNAGGMTLEETPSRLAALRNTYALVVDYVHPAEVEPRLAQFFEEDFYIEIHVLYEKGKESRRQWLFIDEDGNVRLNAVFKPEPEEAEDLSDEVPVDLEDQDGSADEFEDEELIAEELNEDEGELIAEVLEPSLEGATSLEGEGADEEDMSSLEDTSSEIEIAEAEAAEPHSADIAIEEPPAPVLSTDTLKSIGFIELYNAETQIIEDRWLFEDDNEIIVTYFYNENTLVRAETREVLSGAPPVKVYTDFYRYNRAFSLRKVERLYHEMAEAQPVLLTFPYRVLEAAASEDFISDKLYLGSEFMGNFAVGEGFHMTYETDSRGRILNQTMLNDKDETVWTIQNTWAGDRIVSVLKIEGDEKKLTEYEYDSGGNRIVQRDMNNGIVERLVRTEGNKETEELYMNGSVVLRAYWENGRKVKEERVRR